MYKYPVDSPFDYSNNTVSCSDFNFFKKFTVYSFDDIKNLRVGELVWIKPRVNRGNRILAKVEEVILEDQNNLLVVASHPSVEIRMPVNISDSTDIYHVDMKEKVMIFKLKAIALLNRLHSVRSYGL